MQVKAFERYIPLNNFVYLKYNRINGLVGE